MRVMTGYTDYTMCHNRKTFKFRVAVETEGNDLSTISRRDFQEILYKTAEAWREILDSEEEDIEEIED